MNDQEANAPNPSPEPEAQPAMEAQAEPQAEASSGEAQDALESQALAAVEAGAGSGEPIVQAAAEPDAQPAWQQTGPGAPDENVPLEAGLFWPAPAAAPRRLHPVASLAIDLGVGLSALVPLIVILGIAVLAHLFSARSLPRMIPITAVFFVAVAMVRAIWSRMNPWIEGLFIGLGASIPLLAFAVAGAGRPLRIAAFVAALAIVCGAGAQITRFLKAGQKPLAGAVAVALAVLVAFATKYTPMPTLPTAGLRTMDSPAPTLTLAALDGNPVALGSLKGRVVVLDFWGTWCEPCMAEMPSVVRVHDKYQANPNVVFFAVNPGWHGDTADKIRNTARQKHIDLSLALDRPAALAFGVEALPTLIVIDRQGHIRVENSGYDPGEDLEGELSGQIDQFLSKDAPQNMKTASR